MSFIYLLLLILIFAGLVVLLILFSSRENRGNEEEMEQLRVELRELKAEHAREARANREETTRSIMEVNRTLHSQINEMNSSQMQQVSVLTKNSDEAAERLRLTIDEKLSAIYLSNEKKLDEMRRTVDEKLENTLNQRIGESFSQVNERLEMVHKSLGEIQGLSSGITDIKKIFSNVKTRGVWGEVQLAQILEEILTPDQYEANVSTGAKSEEKVEFAVCLPGRDETQGKVYLPIDSKFPAEDYGRLMTAAENGDAVLAAECRKSLERTLKNEAKMIRDKYIEPPKTLDYAIMFLPTEGLYSEALRLPSFMEYAAEQRVMVTGPTNL
ncbi:MAG: DNA recombination protein RmuC, partial [Clostridia bacterium]